MPAHSRGKPHLVTLFLNKKLIVKQREVIEMKTEEVIKIVEIVFEAALKITKAVVMEEGKK